MVLHITAMLLVALWATQASVWRDMPKLGEVDMPHQQADDGLPPKDSKNMACLVLYITCQAAQFHSVYNLHALLRTTVKCPCPPAPL